MKPLAPTLGNAIAMIGAPRHENVVRPSVSVAAYASLPDLLRAIETIDERFDRHLALAIELPADLAPEWRRLSRAANPGGRLAIVVAQASPVGALMPQPETLGAKVAGWDDVHACASIDEALRRLLHRSGVKQCFVLRPEGSDPAPVLQAIGLYLTS
jgi:hypothetical protein